MSTSPFSIQSTAYFKIDEAGYIGQLEANYENGVVINFDYFFALYYQNKFVDQKLFALLTLLETVYDKKITSRKMEKSEFSRHVREKTDYLPDRYKEEVRTCLGSRNRISQKERLEGLAKYSKNMKNTDRMIKDLITFRNDLAHGRGLVNFTVDRIVDLHDFAFSMYQNFVRTFILEE